MPKSKRATLISLTRTKTKGREAKESLVSNIKEAIDNYTHIYLFSVVDMRNACLKDVRNKWNHSRFFFGKNRVMTKALGTTPEDETLENLHLVSEKLKGNVGLLFSNCSPEETTGFFESYTEKDFARCGNKATETITIPAGVVNRGEEPFPHNMEPQLRSLGMPTSLVKGAVTLNTDFTICTKGSPLTSQQAQLLKLFLIPMADFKVTILGYYCNGKYVSLEEKEE